MLRHSWMAPDVPVWIVDTFADHLYQGNPAGVVILQDGFPPTAEMQSTALHLGLPTTAFVVPGEAAQYRIRWFTPEKELNLCGHATMASAAYLYENEGANPSLEVCFHTRSGLLYAHRDAGHISLSLPRMDISPCAPPAGLDAALGAEIHYCGQAIDDILVEVANEVAVAKLQPDFEEMRGMPWRGHIVTACSGDPATDFVSRTFFPALGVNEDQVCVSAHCKLGPYWAERLNKRRLSAVQLSARGGRLLLEVRSDRVQVAGTAIVRGRSPLYAREGEATRKEVGNR